MSIFDYFHKTENPKAPQTPRDLSNRDRLTAFAANVEEDKKRYPEDEEEIQRIFETLRVRYKKNILSISKQGEEENAAAAFFLSKDRLRAYACVFPPQNGGADVNMDGFLSKMRYEGITYGILQEEVRRRINAQDYLHIFPIAVGDPPQDGSNGQVEELYERRPVSDFSVPDDALADFSEHGFVLPVGVGDIICRVQPPETGRPGKDVTGQVLNCYAGIPAQLPRGKGTQIGAGGLALVSETEGLLYFHDDAFCVRPAKLIDGGLCGVRVPLRFKGDVYVGGSLSGGVSLEASGDVFISGDVRDARVRSVQGNIRIQGCVLGAETETSLHAAGQVQAASIENADVEAGGNVFAQKISNSNIISGGSVNALAGEGTIVGGYIQAMHRVVCQHLGCPDGTRCQVMVGCDPQTVAEWEQNHTAMAETQKVLDTLWENVTTLRRTEAWLNEEQKAVLKQLLEQRSLYEQKRDSLKKEREVLREQMKAARFGRVKCHELFPVLEIRLGERKGEVKSHEYECDIHLREDNAILMR